jgi:hypothetical protein
LVDADALLATTAEHFQQSAFESIVARRNLSDSHAIAIERFRRFLGRQKNVFDESVTISMKRERTFDDLAPAVVFLARSERTPSASRRLLGLLRARPCRRWESKPFALFENASAANEIAHQTLHQGLLTWMKPCATNDLVDAQRVVCLSQQTFDAGRA